MRIERDWSVQDAIDINLAHLRRASKPLPPSANACEFVETFLRCAETDGFVQTHGIGLLPISDIPDVWKDAA